MNSLQIFTYNDHPVRVVELDGEPWLVGKDVAEVLGYKEPKKAIWDHVDPEDKGGSKMETPGGVQDVTIINESGMYSLILASKLPSAKNFKRWVTSEVLPTIRRHGAYATAPTIDRIIADPDYGISLLSALKAERARNASLALENAVQAQQLAEAKPKVGYYDMVLASPSLVKTSVIAKDYGFSARKFNLLLNDLGIQFKQGDIWLLYQKYADKGYTQTETYHYKNVHTGEDGTQCWTKWTQKGRLFLYDLLKAHGYLPTVERSEQ